MNEFNYHRALNIDDAIAQAGGVNSRFIAGGTTQLDLMKCGVETPENLIDIKHLSGLNDITFSADTLRIGALAHMSEVAADVRCRSQAPVIYESLWQAASPQIRNMATIGGNLRQRTRCVYFRDPGAFSACNKRRPGSGCSALHGINRNYAVLGVSESCVALYPGDLAVALTAFDARVILRNAAGQERRIPIDSFYLLPGNTPDKEHDMAADEMIIAVEVPIVPALRRSHYLKVRDRTSYEFAAASAAVGLDLDGTVIRDIHIAMGGVATKPWRARAVEAALRGKPFNEDEIRRAAALITADARPLEHNRFKIVLAPRVITRALLTAGQPSPGEKS
ncbi:FAD binding domain-containing protein [Sodalis ligni]|uniref:Xanthine dehydrogenase YagS FAD-binding subunit n=1 Tax=Sodalis ligni TaxID=2697027 RepID=A0A4R1N6Q8_9GAMM|nr:xanthine dehydrogenase family protein subunit M [Sodalis ligni]TCL02934.1 xanthine dehydrogenase YagS FAD-binding subunit [Sodalis ligni]